MTRRLGQWCPAITSHGTGYAGGVCRLPSLAALAERAAEATARRALAHRGSLYRSGPDWIATDGYGLSVHSTSPCRAVRGYLATQAQRGVL